MYEFRLPIAAAGCAGVGPAQDKKTISRAKPSPRHFLGLLYLNRKQLQSVCAEFLLISFCWSTSTCASLLFSVKMLRFALARARPVPRLAGVRALSTGPTNKVCWKWRTKGGPAGFCVERLLSAHRSASSASVTWVSTWRTTSPNTTTSWYVVLWCGICYAEG
jgi:hypothetical protein